MALDAKQHALLEKYSFSPAELHSMEAAMQYLMVQDICSVVADGENEYAQQRFDVLKARAAKNPVLTTVPWSLAGLESHSADLLRHMRGFSQPDQRLRLVIAMVEVATSLPYCGWAGSPLLKTVRDDKSIRKTLEAFAAASSREYAEYAGVIIECLREAAGTYVPTGALGLNTVFKRSPSTGPVFVEKDCAFLGWRSERAPMVALVLCGGGSLGIEQYRLPGGLVMVAESSATSSVAHSIASALVGHAIGPVFLPSVGIPIVVEDGLLSGGSGDILAGFTSLRAELTVRTLTSLRLLDHQVAGELASALQTALLRYGSAAPVRAHLQRCIERTKAFVETHHRTRGLHERPIAWHRAPPAQSGPVTPRQAAAVPSSDAEFALAFQQLDIQHQRLRDCLEFMRNAHRRYSEVKDAGYFRGLWDQFTGDTREKLMRADAQLSCALDKVIEVARSVQTQIENLRKIVDKVNRSLEQTRQLEELAGRYRRITLQLQELLQKEQQKNEGLRKQLAELQAKVAIGALWYAAQNTNNALPILPGNSRTDSTSGASNTTWATEQDVQIGLALQAGLSIDDLAAGGADRARVSSVFEALGAIEIMLGEPPAVAQKMRATKLAELHPDRGLSANPIVRERQTIARTNVEHGFELHLLYAQMRTSAAA